MVVDGCGVGTTFYALETLRHYRARPDLIVLTHPHLDHARGIAELVDEFSRSPHTAGTPWPTLGVIIPPTPGLPGSTQNPQEFNQRAVTLAAINTIHDRWQRVPSTRWELRPGDQRPLGQATLTVVSPEDDARHAAIEAWREKKAYDLNRASSALVLDWGNQRVVLGSDLVEVPGKGWSKALRRSTTLALHGVLKVPHHGSKGAQDKGLLKRQKQHAPPAWMVTPFAPSGLPRMGNGDGMATLLKHVAQIHLTALPRGHGDQAGAPLRLRRKALVNSASITFDQKTPGFPDCYVVAELPPQGDATLHYGPGSVVVER